MPVVAHLIELKAQSQSTVEDWTRFMQQHREEALASLAAEGVQLESWFSLSLEGRDYLLCYMRVDDLARSQAVHAASPREVDAYHQAFKVQAWVRGGHVDAKLLLDLSPEA